MTREQAYIVASQWGSFMSSGDPGACLYSFRFNDGRPVSEQHRAQCLAYLESDLLPLANAADRRELVELRAYLSTCEVRP